MTSALVPLPSRLPIPVQGFEEFLRRLRQVPPLSAERERELARACREGDADAARQLALANMSYVVWIARRYHGYGLPLPDLVQEGAIGLLQAIRRFDPDSGVRLISYAVQWIRSAIHEYVLRNWRIVRRATTKAQRKLFFHRGRLDATAASGAAGDVTLATELRLTPGQVADMRQRLAASDVALDSQTWEPVDNREPSVLLEEIEEQAGAGPQLRQALSALDARSRDILERRWLSDKPSALGELAAQYGISAERVRQIQNRALLQLREVLAPVAIPA